MFLNKTERGLVSKIMKHFLCSKSHYRNTPTNPTRLMSSFLDPLHRSGPCPHAAHWNRMWGGSQVALHPPKWTRRESLWVLCLLGLVKCRSWTSFKSYSWPQLLSLSTRLPAFPWQILQWSPGWSTAAGSWAVRMTKLVCIIQTARPALNCDNSEEERLQPLGTHFLVFSPKRMEKGRLRQKPRGK